MNDLLIDRHLPSHTMGLAWEIATSLINHMAGCLAQPRVGTQQKFNKFKTFKDNDLKNMQDMKVHALAKAELNWSKTAL